MELSLPPLVDRDVSRGMSRWGCGLRKSLGSLLMAGAVSAQCVTWPEASLPALIPIEC